MYEKFFHLNKRPFSIAPDPGFLYMSERHRDALAHLKYGLESDGGFVLVTGEVGTGKTTLLRNLIGQVPGDIDVAFILNPRLTVRELLQTICDELAIEYPAEDQHSVKPYIDRLNKHLLRTHRLGRSTVVVIDEAQNLSPAVLEQLRLLTNLETNERKLMRIILVGQPELKTMLARQELRQLSQRITARYHLEPLKLEDTRAYLAHRLTVSGGNPNLFSRWASWNIHRHAGGIPRLINIIADRAMLGAYADGKPRIDFLTSQKAASETTNRPRNLWGWLALVGAVLIAIGGTWALLDTTGSAPAITRPVTSTGVSQPTVEIREQLRPARDTGDVQSQPEPLTEIVVRNQTTTPALATNVETATPLLPIGAARDSGTPNGPEISPDVALTTNQQSNSPDRPAVQGTIPPPSIPRPAMPSVADISQQSVTSSSQPPRALPNVPPYRSQRMAFNAMYELWGITYEANNALVPCDYAPRFQLQCTKRNYSWADVTRLNVPVVMRLVGRDAQPFYVTAVSARDNRISITQGGKRSVVDLATLSQVWDGTIIALWPTPENYRGSIRDGSSGTAVQELRDLLGKAVNRDLGNSRRFDASLSALLRDFQSASGLVADGIAGPATWLLLHRAAGYDIPELMG